METKDLITLIDKFLDEYKELQKTSEDHLLLKDLFTELITYLNLSPDGLNDNKLVITLLLDEIYRDDIKVTEFYNLLHSNDNEKDRLRKFRGFCKRIEHDAEVNQQELNELNLRIFRNRYLPASAKRVKICLLHDIPINQDKYDITNIKRILKYYEAAGIITNKEELTLINIIELHNRKTITEKNKNKKEAEFVDTLVNEVPNIINAGFQEHDKIEVNDERKVSLDKLIKEILSYIELLDREESLECLKRYQSFNLEDNEYSYIIVGILNAYLDELLSHYQLLTDKEIYRNHKDRMDVIKDYYHKLDKYIALLKYYNKLNNYAVKDEEETPEMSTLELGKTKELIYAHTYSSDKVKIISDLKLVPHEYYQTIIYLLNDFINNKISKKDIKPLTKNGNITQFIELKYDQIRIVLKHLKDNIYCVMGIGVKKSDNDVTMYRNLVNRRIPDISTEEKLKKELELSEYIKKELDRIVQEKGRKGTR